MVNVVIMWVIPHPASIIVYDGIIFRKRGKIFVPTLYFGTMGHNRKLECMVSLVMYVWDV